MAHMGEHLAWQYRLRIQQFMPGPLPPAPNFHALRPDQMVTQEIPPQIEAQIDMAAAQAAQQVIKAFPPPPSPEQKKQQEEQQKAQADMQVKAADAQIKAKTAEAAIATKVKAAQTDEEIARRKDQRDAQAWAAEEQRRQAEWEEEQSRLEAAAIQEMLIDQKEAAVQMEIAEEKADTDQEIAKKRAASAAKATSQRTEGWQEMTLPRQCIEWFRTDFTEDQDDELHQISLILTGSAGHHEESWAAHSSHGSIPKLAEAVFWPKDRRGKPRESPSKRRRLTDMPLPEVRARGGAKRTVTVKAGKNKYMHCDIVPKAGPRGGHTVCGPTKTKKKGRRGKRGG